MTPPPAEQLVAAALGLCLTCWLALRARRMLAAWRLRRRARRGAAGHRAARKLLERRGFEVLAEEHRVPGVVEVDGQRHDYQVRVDYVARRRGRCYCVEVKTGDKAPDPLYRPTRRQLLEYAQLWPLDGVLLLDMETHQLRRVRFPQPGSRRALGAAWLVALGFLLGVAAAALWLSSRAA